MQSNGWIPLFPESASTFSWQVDALYFYLIAVSLFFTVGIVAVIFFFVLKYREKEKYSSGKEIHGSIALETVWSIIPFIIAMTIFLGGAIIYFNQYWMPKDAMEIYVVGKQWMWKVQHGTGQREINELHVPVNRAIKLTMTTEDVIHDFGLPEFRTKMDVVPGRYTYLWFEATKPGTYRIQCMEYCGLNHSGMGGYVYVMEQRDFDNWLAGNVSDQTPVQAGQDLFTNKLGCASCHAGGANQRGAPVEGIYGKEVKLTNGQTVIVDDQYIRNSILNPSSQIVAGYQPIMPTYKGQVTEEQLNQLVAYIKSLTTGTGTGTGTTTTGGATTTTGTGTTSGTTMTNTATNVLTPRRADRGGEDNPGSNPNAPSNRPAVTNRDNR